MIVKHEYKITQKERELLLNQKAFVIWFTGLSGSGKSTISNALEEYLYKHNKKTYSLDGDNIRFGLNKDLGFSDKDREENIRRIGEVSNLFLDSGLIVLSSFISPFEKDREIVKNIVGKENFIEVFVDTNLEVCEKRDPKGLYKKARNGEIKSFTGIDSPYEKPSNPNLIINTENKTIEDCLNIILNYLKEKNYVN